MTRAVLWILGMPLSDGDTPDERARRELERADLVIGESRKTTVRVLARIPGGREKPVAFLDESARPEERDWKTPLSAIAKRGGSVALFSDTGMPLLFDPGVEVLNHCLKLGFEVRCWSGPTSWGSACALSGWPPPFLVVGFPPREKADRAGFWNDLRQRSETCVLMERPYALMALLDESIKTFGASRPAFLAWELDGENQRLIWEALGAIRAEVGRFTKTKGEFVLVVKGVSSRLRSTD